MNHKLLFIDTEATGNDTDKDRLMQVAYAVNDGEIRVGLFKPPLPISVKSMSITHITNKMVEKAPPFAGSALAQDLARLLSDHIFIAHNALFDKAIIEAEGIAVPKFICTMRVARHLDGEAMIPEHNLQFLRYYLDLDIADANAHSADGDVKVLRALFNRQLIKMIENEGSEEAAIDKMMEVSSRPTLIKKINFGKYRGQTFEEVAKTDRGYLEWLWQQKTNDGVDPETDDVMFTVRSYLN